MGAGPEQHMLESGCIPIICYPTHASLLPPIWERISSVALKFLIVPLWLSCWSVSSEKHIQTASMAAWAGCPKCLANVLQIKPQQKKTPFSSFPLQYPWERDLVASRSKLRHTRGKGMEIWDLRRITDLSPAWSLRWATSQRQNKLSSTKLVVRQLYLCSSKQGMSKSQGDYPAQFVGILACPVLLEFITQNRHWNGRIIGEEVWESALMMPITQQVSSATFRKELPSHVIHLQSPQHTFTPCLTGIQKLPLKNLPEAKYSWANSWFQDYLLWHPVAWISTHHTHRCAHSNIWRFGQNSETTFHHSMQQFRKFSEHHQTLSLHSSLPASRIRKEALTSAFPALILPIISSVS